jgi:hypothetical protein
MKVALALRRAPRPEAKTVEALGDAAADDEFLRDLHRRVGWQAAVAYGMPLAEAEVRPAEDAAFGPEPKPVPTPVPEQPERPALVLCEPAPEPELRTDPELPTVAELELLIAERRDANPERAADWRWSLQHLREFADCDGRLPEDFRATVEVVFGEVLSARVPA